MPHNILFIDSRHKNTKEAWFDFFDELLHRGNKIIIHSSCPSTLRKFKKDGKTIKNVRFHLDPDSSLLQRIVSEIFLPLNSIRLFFFCLYHQQRNQIKNIICSGLWEKISITIPARLLRINVIWIEHPDFDYALLHKRLYLRWLYRLNARFATMMHFTDISEKKTGQYKINPSKKIRVPFGIKTNSHKHQENIFNDIAARESELHGKKFFTVGTVIDLDKNQKIEVLFHAAEKCLSVIPNLQIIIVGDGEERKNLAWLTKKMEINDMVWFVGEQQHLRKWLDTFDVFAATFEKASINDIDIAIRAAAAKVPIISSEKQELTDVAKNNINAIIMENNDSETIAGNIINLYKNKELRLKLGKNGEELVDKYFLLVNMVEQFEKSLK